MELTDFIKIAQAAAFKTKAEEAAADAWENGYLSGEMNRAAADVWGRGTTPQPATFTFVQAAAYYGATSKFPSLKEPKYRLGSVRLVRNLPPDPEYIDDVVGDMYRAAIDTWKRHDDLKAALDAIDPVVRERWLQETIVEQAERVAAQGTWAEQMEREARQLWEAENQRRAENFRRDLTQNLAPIFGIFNKISGSKQRFRGSVYTLNLKGQNQGFLPCGSVYVVPDDSVEALLRAKTPEEIKQSGAEILHFHVDLKPLLNEGKVRVMVSAVSEDAEMGEEVYNSIEELQVALAKWTGTNAPDLVSAVAKHLTEGEGPSRGSPRGPAP